MRMLINKGVGKLKLVRGNMNALVYTDNSQDCLKSTIRDNFKDTKNVFFNMIQQPVNSQKKLS